MRENAGPFGNQLEAIGCDCRVDRDLLVVDRARLADRICGSEDAVDRPSKVDRGRARFAHSLRRLCEHRIVSDGRAKQRDAVGGEDADAGRTAYRKAFYRSDDFLGRPRALVAHLVRKQALIEISYRVAVPGDDRSLPKLS